jgi:hypothetical protein
MMDSTDYNNVKYIGERVDMESTIKLVHECLPNHNQDDMAENTDVLQQFWGSREDTIRRAKRFLQGETLSESEYASGLDTSSESDDHSDKDEDEEEEEEDEDNNPNTGQSTSVPTIAKRNNKTKFDSVKTPNRKKGRSRKKEQDEYEEDSFIDNDEEDEDHGDWHPENSDTEATSSIQSHNKISDENSEEDGHSEPSNEL